MGTTAIVSAILTLLAGIGIFLVACQMMSSNLESASSSKLKSLFANASKSKLLGVGIGTVGTAAIQSSGATTVMTIGFVNAGIISLTQAATIIFGANIGTTVTPQTQLAMFHTFFNVITVMFMLPLTGALVGLVTKIIKDTETTSEEVLRLHYVDDNMLKAPPIAAAQTKREILRMAELPMENFDRSIDIITTLDFSDREVFDRTETEINFINRTLVDFVVRLSDRRGLGAHDKLFLSTVYRTVRDIERIGDYANESLEDLEQANLIEEQIDDFTKRLEDSHIERLGNGICNANTGAQYMELSSNTERIADHLINVAKTIRGLKGCPPESCRDVSLRQIIFVKRRSVSKIFLKSCWN